MRHYVLLTVTLSRCLPEYSVLTTRFRVNIQTYQMGRAITSTLPGTRISPRECGTCSLLRYQVDHCIVAQLLLSRSVSAFVLASCHLTYVSIPTAKDAVVGLSAKNRLG